MTPPLHTPDRKGKIAYPKRPKLYYASIDSSVTINDKCAYIVFEVVLGDYIVVEHGYIDCYKYHVDKMKAIEAMCDSLKGRFGEGLNIISV